MAALGVAGSEASPFCLFVAALLGVAIRIGVTGTTGTAGVMVDEVVRDIGRDAGRTRDSSMTAFGIAGAVKPGGMLGVERRGYSRKWLLIGVMGMPRIGSLSLSLTRASTLRDACSSALSGTSSTRRQYSLSTWLKTISTTRVGCGDHSGRRTMAKMVLTKQ